MKIYELLEKKPEYRSIIEKIISYEETNKEKFEKYKGEYNSEMGWTWSDVGVHPIKLNKLIEYGIIKIVYKSNRITEYRLTNLEEIKNLLEICYSSKNIKREEKTVEISKLFKDIVGHKDIKKAFRLALKSKKPVHILLIGPPATAKTIFLEEIYNNFPNSEFVIGSSTSSSGLFNLLYEKRPKYLLIDEIDKLLSQDNLSVLLSLMESGYIRKTKHNLSTDMIYLDTKVFASGNKDNLPKELSDRFIKFYLREYTKEEFIEICEKYISKTENVDEELVRYVAEKIWEINKSIRTVRNILRMSNNKDDIDFIINTLYKYSKV